jgi:hypothetical protein
MNPTQIIYHITIEPILTGGDPDSGKFLTLGGIQRIDSIDFEISGTQQRTYLYNDGIPVYYYPDGTNSDSSINSLDNYNPIIFTEFFVSNNIFNPVGRVGFSVIINSGNGKNLFASPFCDLFRAGDIIRVYYFTPESAGIQQLFVGEIETPEIDSDLSGTRITFTAGYLPNILQRSQMVQTQSDQVINGLTLTSIAPTNIQFDDLLSKLLDETYINQTISETQYFGGITDGVSEQIAIGKPDTAHPSATKGSALNADSWVFAITVPTGTKLDCILQILYPYQRVFYVDTKGDFIITPLTTFFDETENWKVDLFGDPDAIPLLGIKTIKNTALLQNRAYCTFNQLFTEFNQSNPNSTQSNSAFSIATPPQDLFPRAYDFVQSTLGLQTIFDIEAFDGNAILQNSGILNTAINMVNGVTGMVSVLNIDNQNSHITNTDSKLDFVKYLMSLYASRKLAESLFEDLLVDINMATISTYSTELGRFRQLPLNQMVQMPLVNNNNFDGQPQLFCYGFNLRWGANGSITTLNLCKPYVFTALWCDSLEQI